MWGEGSHCFLSLNAHSDAMAVLHEPQKEEQQKASTWQLSPTSPFGKKKKSIKKKKKHTLQKLEGKKKNPALEMLKRKTKSSLRLTKEKQCFV